MSEHEEFTIPGEVDSLEAVPQHLRGAYAAGDDGKFRPRVGNTESGYSFQNVAGIRSALEKERAEAAASRARAKELEIKLSEFGDLDPAADDNFVGSRIFRFEHFDEIVMSVSLVQKDGQAGLLRDIKLPAKSAQLRFTRREIAEVVQPAFPHSDNHLFLYQCAYERITVVRIVRRMMRMHTGRRIQNAR